MRYLLYSIIYFNNRFEIVNFLICLVIFITLTKTIKKLEFIKFT